MRGGEGGEAEQLYTAQDRVSNKKIKHTPKENVYCGVLQYRKAPQPQMLVSVGVGVVLYLGGLNNTAPLQYQPAYKQKTACSNG